MRGPGMRKTVSLVLFVALLGALLYVARLRGLDRLLLGGGRLGAPATPVATAWKTEEEWVAGEIARDVAEMTFHIRHRRPPAEGEVRVAARTTGAAGVSPIRVSSSIAGSPERSVDLPLGFLWDPAEFVPVARLAAQQLGLSAGSALAEGEQSAGALVEPTVGLVEAENRRVSAALAARPGDPAAHESAALVLAALALRESAGLSHDVRPALCRMTAHLSVADARRTGPASRDGRIARVALLVLAQRGAEAEQAVAALSPEVPAEESWRRALFIRLTEDWRALEDPERATLIERMSQVRARLRAGDHSALLEHVASLARGDHAELARVAMDDVTQLSVEAGNALVPQGLATEEAGLAQVYRAVHGNDLHDDDRVAALSGEPERCITKAGPRAIGWGTWSAYFRRHILHQMTVDEWLTRHLLGLPDRADEKGAFYDARYGALPHYSFLQDRRESHAGIRPTRFAESITSLVEQPESVTAFHFYVAWDLATKEVIRRGPPHRSGWFAPPLPRGTTFDYRLRRQALGFEPKGEAAETLRAISPRDQAVLEAVAASHPKDAPAAELERRFGARMDYDVKLLNVLASAVWGNRPQLWAVDERLCAVGPRWCGPLGLLMIEDGRDREAAPLLRGVYDELADRVSASWYAPWLVAHYLAGGHRREARAVAEEAASTGSWNGLRAMVTLHEGEGRYREAEELLKGMRERYGDDDRADPPQEDDDDELIAFYHRMVIERRDRTYAARLRELGGRTFPGGIERLDRASLTADAAREGVAILQGNPTTNHFGLEAGDVIVGVDGYRVRNVRQYQVARRLRPETEMTLYVFRNPNGFVEVKTRAWNRWFNTTLRTNAPGQPTIRG
jgi:hypothetical protein